MRLWKDVPLYLPLRRRQLKVQSMGCDCDSQVRYFDNLIRQGDKRGWRVLQSSQTTGTTIKWLFSIDELFLLLNF